MKKKLCLFFILLIIWILLTLPFNIQNLLLGIVISFIVSLIFKDYYSERIAEVFRIKKIIAIIKYIFTFLYYMLLANLDVMYRVLHPSLPINPGIVKVKTELKSNLAKTILANSITLTPGTLTVDIEGEFLYIHWINVKSANIEDATGYIVKRFEKILKEIFE
ncbi:MAG: hypothetical protein DRI36_00665 [Caldiserica bacterium]|nr:MAG: hypothetical protein DRI36_00665 [Caldisericota bacterium]